MSLLTQVFEHAFTLPTTVWSVLLILVVLFWGISLLGMFDLEILGGLADAAEGLSDVTEGLEEGGAERPGFLEKAGFGDVPRPISWSLVVVFGWTASLLLSLYVPSYREIATRGLVFAGGLGLLTLAAGVGTTAVAIQPLRRALTAGLGIGRAELVGRTCTVRTLKVDEKFGQAEVDEGAMLVQVRAPEPNGFARGSKALIFDYDKDREVFSITEFDDVL